MNNNRTLLLSVFILVSLIQLFVPAKMIWDSERVFKVGTPFKFKTAPVDPIDPFRGKYIVLRYEESTFYVENSTDWELGGEAYISVSNDSEGFATIDTVTKSKPIHQPHYFAAEVNYFMRDGASQLRINYPFDRYYMDEFKAYNAEKLYREVQQDSSKNTYGLVYVNNGKALLKSVMIDDVPIEQLVNDLE